MLCKIAGTDRCDIAKLLIEKGADINQADQVSCWTPCFVSTWFIEVEMLAFLVRRGANINAYDFQGRVPLVIAVIRNNTQCVSVLLNNGAELFSASEVCDSSLEIDFSYLLEEALNINNPNIIQMLTENIKGRNLIITTFPMAIRKKSTMRKLLKIFLTEIESDDMKSPLWNEFIEICNAIFNNDIYILENIFAKAEQFDAFSTLQGSSSIKQKKKMLATFNENYLRFCPLHISAVCDNTTAAEILIRNGANPFQRDVRERTSLHLANSGDMLKILLNTNDEPKYSYNFSQFSFIKTDLIFFRPKFNLKANVRDINGNTSIHSLIIRMTDPKKCLDTVETLIKNGADTCLRCNGGFLPIDLYKTFFSG